VVGCVTNRDDIVSVFASFSASTSAAAILPVDDPLRLLLEVSSDVVDVDFWFGEELELFGCPSELSCKLLSVGEPFDFKVLFEPGELALGDCGVTMTGMI